MKKVSVIVAVYGVEDWIEESLTSLLTQSLPPEQLEIILVNDATPDSSMTLARRLIEANFPERLPYVKFIDHEVNTGVGQTRRDGISHATGDYIIHFDPDDILLPRAYEIMLAEAERTGADITLCDFVFLNGEKRIVIRQRPNEMTARALMEQICGAQAPSRHGSMCNKLVRKELYDGVEIPQGINFCEDAITVCTMLSLPGVTVASTDQALYVYRFRSGSMVTTPDYEADARLYREIARRAESAAEVWQRNAFGAFISTLLYQRSYVEFTATCAEFAALFGEFAPYVGLSAIVPPHKKKLMRRALEGKRLPSKLMRRIGYAIARRLRRS